MASLSPPSPSPADAASRPPRPSLSHLPRDARDTLFLLAVIGWTVLPHMTHLPVWCSVLTTVVLLWRARLAVTLAPLPNRWGLIAVLVFAAAGTLWSYQTLLGKEPGVTLAVVLSLLCLGGISLMLICMLKL